MSSAVAYGALLVTALLILAGSVAIFMRLQGDQPRADTKRPPMPIAWPVSEAAASVLPGGPNGAAEAAPETRESAAPSR